MTDRITGKVARLNSDRELIINRGKADGVKTGMTFAIKGDAIEVIDPETGDPLGEVLPIKVVIRVNEVSEKFSIARTFRSRRVEVEAGSPGGALYHSSGLSAISGLGGMMQPPKPAKYETRYETLRLDPERASPIDEGSSVVQVGDLVEQVLEGEEVGSGSTTLFR